MNSRDRKAVRVGPDITSEWAGRVHKDVRLARQETGSRGWGGGGSRRVCACGLDHNEKLPPDKREEAHEYNQRLTRFVTKQQAVIGCEAALCFSRDTPTPSSLFKLRLRSVKRDWMTFCHVQNGTRGGSKCKRRK